MRVATLSLIILSLAPAAGCSETYQRIDGVTPAAGDAIAANTVMQMVDPWQYGVQDTNLRVPAERGTTSQAAGEGESASGSTTGGDSSPAPTN